MRIVSTVPSITELLYDLNLEEEVVGITKFCVHPNHWYRNKTRIGGTKTLNVQKIIELKPDLIIANKEENVKEQIEELSKYTKTIVTNIKTVEDNYKLIDLVSKNTNRSEEGKVLCEKYDKVLYTIAQHKVNCTAAYLIWEDPIMTIGKGTYIHSVLNLCGIENVAKESIRYPTISMDELQEFKSDMILLSTEPFPYKEKHVQIYKKQFPHTKIMIVDGELFSWYGTRLINSLDGIISFLTACNNRVN
jgi:ABC-type Fe3+-hydroxamate transport system substrate-binding protein